MDSLASNSETTDTEDKGFPKLSAVSVNSYSNNLTIHHIELNKSIEVFQRNEYAATRNVRIGRFLAALKNCLVANVPSTDYIISLCSDYRSQESNFEILDTCKWKRIFSSEKFPGVISDIDSNPLNNYTVLPSSTKDKAYYLYDFKQQTLLRETKKHPMQNTITSVSFQPDGYLLAAVDNRSLLTISDIKTTNYSYTGNLGGQWDFPYTIRWNPTFGSSLIAMINSTQALLLIDIVKTTSGLRTVELEKPEVKCIEWKGDGNVLAIGDKDGGLFLWDTRSNKTLTQANLEDSVSSVKWSGDENYVGTCNGRGFQLIDMRMMEVVYPRKKENPKLNFSASSCCFI